MYNYNGDNMKKLFGLLIFLFLLYFGIQILFGFLSKGGSIDYTLEKDNYKFYVKEVSELRKSDIYKFKIDVDNVTFNFKLNKDFKNKTQIINDIYYFSNKNYKCILPIFKDQIVLDMMCLKDGIMTYAFNINDSGVTEFKNSIPNYDITKWQDDLNEVKKDGKILGYNNNIEENHMIAFTTYRGVMTYYKVIMGALKNLVLFSQDTYKTNLSYFVDNYYISAEYSYKYDFKEFNIIDLNNLSKVKITNTKVMSLDSIIQGYVDGSLYIYDNTYKKQYELDIGNRSIIEVGNDVKGIKYYNNGEWSIINTKEAATKKFITSTIDYQNNNYIRIDKTDNYYYLYKKDGNIYHAYRTDIDDKSNLTYLFDTSDVNRISYIDDFVYYVNSEFIMCYSDMKGNRKIIDYSELLYNKDILVHTYKK